MRFFVANVFLYIALPFSCFPQAKEGWMSKPKDQWPQIALTNHVQFKNGDRYIDPSFHYAGTGFLIDTGKDTLAATAKHVLWVARNKNTKTVQVNRDLKSWTMKPKGKTGDSVVIDRLINEDSTESLEGGSSTITDRDWLVFSIKHSVSGIHPLKPRYSPMRPGEKTYVIGYSYSDSAEKIYEGKVVRKLGMDILIEQLTGYPQPGTSGSPVIDSDGFLIGILSSSSVDAISGKNVTVAVGTEYLKGVLLGQRNLNEPKEDYGKLVLDAVLKRGTRNAIEEYDRLMSDPQNYYVYNLRSANRNGLRETGEKLIELGRFKDAVDILEYNVKMSPFFYVDYNVLARAWMLSGNKQKAIANYKISATKYDDRDENEAFKELVKLGVSR